jgi:hypothetical protein
MALKIKMPAYQTPLLILTLAMVLTVLTSCGGISGSNNVVSNLPTPSVVKNTVPVVAGVSSSGGSLNGVFTSVTVCSPAVYPVGQNPMGGPSPTVTCLTIPNILVDTGSVGLRLLENYAVDGLGLPVVTDSNNHAVQECVQFADFSYAWGPVVRATVQMAGETAAQIPLNYEIANTGIPIQVITSPLNLSIAVPTNCLSSPPAGGLPIAANTLQTLGAAGVLGVGGSFLQDCGATCASSTPPNKYYICPSNLCSAVSVPQDLQLWNPVATFAYDNNGLLLSLPKTPPDAGSGPMNGSLIFGIGTQSDNALGDATVFAIDAYGNFPELTLTYDPDPTLPPTIFTSYLSPQNGSYIDSGSPAIYFSDAQSLGIPECLDQNGNPLGLYCPAAETNYSATVYGTNKTKGVIVWNVQNAATLLNSGNSVFSNLGGDSGINVSTDYVDLGLPFFLGHTIFVGFAGSTIEYPVGQVNLYSNGYWAWAL